MGNGKTLKTAFKASLLDAQLERGNVDSNP